MTNPPNKLLLLRFKTVSDAEWGKLISNGKFKNLFTMISQISSIPGFPTTWLITSIDNELDGTPRKLVNPKVSHYNSHAVDLVPLTIDRVGKYVLHLPIPLNRNILLQNVCNQYGPVQFGDEFPLLAFEADHLHADDLHPSSITYLNTLRSKFDSFWYRVSKSGKYPRLTKAIDDSSLVAIQQRFIV